MGFDIYIQTPDGKHAEGDENYFRFALTALPRALDAMANFGMLTELPIPSAPALSTHGLTIEDFEPGAEPGQETVNRISEYRTAYQAVMDGAESEPTGIPAYKLMVNVGFLVTVAEISAALAAYETHPHVAIAEMPAGDPTWRYWTAFLRRAQTFGGFRTF
ncbi:hypothetical protein ACFXBB_13570 [Streptomyces scopuliridis]|uniref:hypothetical protein n=1 Tax=Streptomyces scopuliridis TaxID=452529 RepID=UPI0036A259A9